MEMSGGGGGSGLDPCASCPGPPPLPLLCPWSSWTRSLPVTRYGALFGRARGQRRSQLVHAPAVAPLHALGRTTLLFPVEAARVAVGDVDVSVGLEHGELQASQDAVQELTARSFVHISTV